MDYRRFNSSQEANAENKRQNQDEQAYEESLIEDLAEDFRLPINHKPTENVDLDNVQQATLDTRLNSSNVGFRLLQKMGWKGKGLGKDEQGITEPIRSGMRDPKLGIGKQEEDDFFTAEENIQRRKLDIEVEETEEHAKKREVLAEREQKIQTEVQEIRKVFYCELCNKQYKLAMEFEVHLSSYDHNHRKRFKEMREMHGSSSRDDRQKREQQRQEREMAKFAQMAGARKQQQRQELHEESGPATSPPPPPVSASASASATATALADQDQRKTLKFGFSSKSSSSKNASGSAVKKPKVAVASIFGNDMPFEGDCCFKFIVSFTRKKNPNCWGFREPYSSQFKVMATKKLIAICQSGGEFEIEKDGSFLYRGGDAHAIDIDDQTKFDDFKMEVAEMFNCSVSTISIKYFLPGNSKTLITVSNDKDLDRMIKFHADSITADVFIMMEEMVAPDVSNMPTSRSSRTTLSEEVPPLDPPLGVVDDTQPSIPLGCSLDIVDNINHIDADMDFPSDIASILPISVVPYEKHAKVADQWENTITGVGQRFSGVQEFRESLRKYAIAHQFAFKYKKNDSHRVTVKCKVEGCPWRIHASRLSTTQLICIKKMNPTHTCGGASLTGGHQATRSWVASIIKDRLKDFPDYKPKDIVNDIKQEYGIQLNYSQAWRAKEIAMEQLQGSYKDAYSQLPSLCERIMETNPGSLATFTTKEDSSFHRLFISFHASLRGFVQGCRPLFFLDSIPLKSKYQGMLLTATAADGDDGIFPVAFAVVDAETNDNWHWFLLQLKSAVSTSCPLTFIADRQKGLRESISEIFKDSCHGYCLRYLTEELVRDLKGQFSHEVNRIITEDLYHAASAPKPEDFYTSVESVKSISLEAYNWIMQSEPQNWANSFFQGARYNHMTSNFGELFYRWASDAHELPITQMVDVIRGNIMELIYTRRAESDHWLTRLTPSMEEKLEKETLKVCSFQVLLTTGSIFEVQGESTEVVDMDRWDCSCKGWQLTGLPCCHAIAVISCVGQSPYDYCSRYFTTESYRLTYAEAIQPIPDVDSPMQNDSSQALVTPPTRRPPGRPNTKKVGPQEVMKRQLQCSRCKGLGHNKATCKELL
ncbi:hypothetical protein V6N13_031286 [Hibiscus sabdariffa]|uniref:SWIM-type domain-containing protein n=1 Tax=Hibiscus sabdariffa TaxID=183260 RepID=A0ABR2CMJ7_9ROSI